MYLYVFVCICMYLYVFVCICMYLFVFVCICIICMYFLCVCVLFCMFFYVYVCVYLCKTFVSTHKYGLRACGANISCECFATCSKPISFESSVANTRLFAASVLLFAGNCNFYDSFAACTKAICYE